jgi:hypothetical protein
LNNLCWWGSVYGYAEQVVDGPCQWAIDLASEDRVALKRDGRGLARALSGDVPGAIEDFETYVVWGRENGEPLDVLARQEDWIRRLEGGEDPAQVFDVETLEALKLE